MLYIAVNFAKNDEPNRWPKNGPLALNVVYIVAQKWPVGKQRVNPFSATGHIFSLCDAVSYLY